MGHPNPQFPELPWLKHTGTSIQKENPLNENLSKLSLNIKVIGNMISLLSLDSQ